MFFCYGGKLLSREFAVERLDLVVGEDGSRFGFRERRLAAVRDENVDATLPAAVRWSSYGSVSLG